MSDNGERLTRPRATADLELRHLTRTFGDIRAVDDVSFTVPAGLLTGFVGGNGAGKTTTMRMLMGVLSPTAGEVLWDGRPITRLDRRRFGYMPEERGLYPKQPVLDQLVYLGRLRGLGASAARASVTTHLERLGLAERAKDHVEKLSLGNQQRVQLAAALVAQPDVLILDEPFSGLDPVGVDALAEALLEQCRQGVPVVFSSHQLDLVERLCDSVGILARGRIVASGTVAELREREAGRLLRVVVPDAAPGWAAALPGVRVVSEQAGDTLLELDRGVDDQAVLAAAVRTGRVSHFAWRQPTLVELFREAVADEPTPTAAGAEVAA
jgi:ABC-2 type transport system ATP-binding protein